MRFFFLAAFWLVSSCCFAQSTQNISWYQQLKGTIGPYPVTLHLHKAGHTYTGYYYYQSQQNPVYFIGEDSTKKGTISLMLFASKQEQEELRFTLSGSEAKGNWKKNASGKPLPFTASAAGAEDIRFTYVFTMGATALRPKLKSSPTATFEAAAIWPEGNSATEAFIKQVVRQAFDSGSTGGEIGGALLRLKKDFLADYASEYNATSDKEIKEMPNAFTLDETSRLMIAYRSPQLLALAHFHYSYSGGAHGNYATQYISLDLRAQKKLQLPDVLTEAGIQALHQLLPRHFRKANGLQPNEALTEGGLFENKLEPTDNFFVTGKGIGFSYAPYEVGPYALGEVQVFIPFTDLQPYLQPHFKNKIE